MEIRLKYMQMIKITGDMQIMSNLGIWTDLLVKFE